MPQRASRITETFVTTVTQCESRDLKKRPAIDAQAVPASKLAMLKSWRQWSALPRWEMTLEGLRVT